MSTLTLSRVMMPWDWIGIVTIRSETLHQPIDDRDDDGQAGVLDTHHLAEAEQHTLLVLGHHSDRERQHDQGDNEEPPRPG